MKCKISIISIVIVVLTICFTSNVMSGSYEPYVSKTPPTDDFIISKFAEPGDKYLGRIGDKYDFKAYVLSKKYGNQVIYFNFFKLDTDVWLVLDAKRGGYKIVPKIE